MLVPEIARQLHVAGVGVLGTDLFRHELPEVPENAIAVISVGAGPADVVMGDSLQGIAADNELFDVVVRNTDRVTTWSKALAVRGALDEFSGQIAGAGGTPDPVTYHRIAKVSGPTEFRVQVRPQSFHVEQRFVAKKERSS